MPHTPDSLAALRKAAYKLCGSIKNKTVREEYFSAFQKWIRNLRSLDDLELLASWMRAPADVLEEEWLALVTERAQVAGLPCGIIEVGGERLGFVWMPGKKS